MMSIAELGSIGEFVASLGVLVTLGFLAWQIRQNTVQARLNSELERSNATIQGAVALMGDNTSAAFTKALTDPTSLTDTEVMQVWAYIDVFVTSVWSTWGSYSRGLCDDHQWEGAKATAQFALAHPVGLVIWNELKHNYPARMIEEVDSYLDGHGVDWTQRQFETMLQGVRNLSGPDA
jgi:hypothetical protein